MTPANLIMLGLGVGAAAGGAGLLMRPGGSEGARKVRLLVGTMLAALGLLLSIFAQGLSHA